MDYLAQVSSSVLRSEGPGIGAAASVCLAGGR